MNQDNIKDNIIRYDIIFVNRTVLVVEYFRIQKTGHSTELSLIYWRMKTKLSQLLKTEHSMLKLIVKKESEISAVFGMQWLLKTFTWTYFSTLAKAERLAQELKENQVRRKDKEYMILSGMRCEIGNGDWRLKINDSLSNDTISIARRKSKDWYFDRMNFKIRTGPNYNKRWNKRLWKSLHVKNACKLIYKILENLIQNLIPFPDFKGSKTIGRFQPHRIFKVSFRLLNA